MIVSKSRVAIFTVINFIETARGLKLSVEDTWDRYEEGVPVHIKAFLRIGCGRLLLGSSPYNPPILNTGSSVNNRYDRAGLLGNELTPQRS